MGSELIEILAGLADLAAGVADARRDPSPIDGPLVAVVVGILATGGGVAAIWLEQGSRTIGALLLGVGLAATATGLWLNRRP